MKLLKENIQIEKNNIDKSKEILSSYKDKLNQLKDTDGYEESESFVRLPFDETFLKQSLELKQEMASEKLRYIIVVGIGGSDLGTKAIYDALFGFFDSMEPERFPKMLFLETTDPKQFIKLKNLLLRIDDPENVLINVISKSGKTLETISNMELLLNNIPYAKERLVITASEKSEMYKKALDLDIKTLGMPETIGGRYSVFTNVGLFPLISAGIDIVKLLEGAMKATVDNLDFEKSASFFSATALKTYYESDKTIHNLFVFEPELESFGKWYEQLIAESIGKNNIGITPMTSVGSTDLHSEGQLDIGGPKDKIFTFLWANYGNISPRIPSKTQFDLIGDLGGKDISKVERSILTAAKTIYEKENIPVMGLELEEISEFVLGELMQYKMIEVAFLGKLLDVNAFDQPDVEEYKKVAKDLLGR